MTDYGSRFKATDLHVNTTDRTLTVVFDDGASFTLPAELLRVWSPSAEVRGHSPDERKTVSGKRDVNIMDVKPVGRYAVKIKFSDLHETGIYSWETLRDFGERQQELWDQYLAELAEKGLSREA